MKTINITPFLLALSLLVSCSSDDDNGPEVIVPQDATLTLAVAPGSVLTKAKAGEPQDGEAKINNMYTPVQSRQYVVDFRLCGFQRPDRGNSRHDTDQRKKRYAIYVCHPCQCREHQLFKY